MRGIQELSQGLRFSVQQDPENEEKESVVGLRRETKAKNTEGDLTRSL